MCQIYYDDPHSTIEDTQEIWQYTKFAKETGPDKSASFEFPTVTSAESIDYQVKHKFKAKVLKYCLREGC